MLSFLAKLATFATRARLRGDSAGVDFARELIWDANRRLDQFRESGPPRLEQKELHELVAPGPLDLDVSELRHEDGGTTPYEMLCLCTITRAVEPQRVFEFGTFKGRNTVLFARNAGAGAEVLTLDLPPEDVDAMVERPIEGDLRYIRKPAIGEYIQATAAGAAIRQLTGDSTTFDFSPWQGACDLVFVDAGHSYTFVKSDTDNAFRMLAPGGVVLWHDYKPGCPGLMRALHEAARERPIAQIRGTSLAIHGLPR